MSSTAFGTRCLCAVLFVTACAARAAEPAAVGNPPAIEPGSTVIPLTASEQNDFRTVRTFVLGNASGSNARVRTLLGINQQFLTEEQLPAAQRISVDTLAEQARGSTDPFVLSILSEACTRDRLQPRPTCDAVDIARRWTVADTQNQFAWLTLASRMRFAGDADGERAAFIQASRASRWHEFYDDGPRVVTVALPRNLGPRARIALQYTALTSSAVWLSSSTAVQELWTLCKDSTLRDACLRIVDTIDRDSGTIFSKQMVASIGRRTGMDAGTVEHRWAALDVLQHAQIDSGLKGYDEITDPKEVARQAGLWDHRVALGELAWSKELAEAGGSAERLAAERFHRQHVAARERFEADERQRIAARARTEGGS